MVRRKQTPVSPYRIYRHFAVVTVVLTAGVAILADGERRAALAEEIEVREQRNELEIASQEKFGKPKLVKKTPQGGGSFGSDSGDFGDPMDDHGSSGSGYVPADLWSSGDSGPVYSRLGLTEAQWAALSEDQRAALRRKADEEAARARTAERRDQVDRLLGASARRAGVASDDG